MVVQNDNFKFAAHIRPVTRVQPYKQFVSKILSQTSSRKSEINNRKEKKNYGNS